MASPGRLTDAQRDLAKTILEDVRKQIADKAGGDAGLAWAMRRYVYIRLQHDERGNPMQRKMLKLKKMVAQNGKCALCGKDLPERGSELDRFDAVKGYTSENTKLVCHECHRAEQEKKAWA